MQSSSVSLTSRVIRIGVLMTFVRFCDENKQTKTESVLNELSKRETKKKFNGEKNVSIYNFWFSDVSGFGATALEVQSYFIVSPAFR